MKRAPLFSSLLGGSLVLAGLVAIVPAANAANRWWDDGSSTDPGNGASAGGVGTWDTTTLNWDQGNGLAHVAWVNGNNDAAILAGTAGTVTMGVPITVGTLTLTGAYTLANGGNSLTINGSGTAISGNAAITLSGAGTITVGANQTWSNSSGTMTISSAVNTGANLLTLSTGQNNLDVTGVIGGTGGLTVNSTYATALSPSNSGNPTLNNSNNYTGTTIINGFIWLNSGGLGALGADLSAVNLNAGGFRLSGTAAVTRGLNLTGNCGISTTTGTTTLNGVISGAGSLQVSANFSSGATIVLGAANTLTGTVSTGADGTLRLAHVNALQNAVLDTTLGARAAINLTTANLAYLIGGITGSGALNLGTGLGGGGGGAVSIGNNNLPSTYSGAFSGAAGVAKIGTGTLTLSGANAFTGALTVKAGTLSVGTVNDAGVAGPLGQSANAVVLGDGAGSTGTLQYTGATAASTKRFTLAAGSTGAFQIDGAAAVLTLSDVVGGTGALNKTGAGGLTLTGVNTYGGGTTVGAGALTLGGAGQLGSGTYNSAITDNGALVFNTSANQVLGGPIGGTGSLTQSGAGTLTLSAANGYGGGTTISGGTLKIANAAGSATGAGAVAVNGGTLTGSGSVSGTVTVGSGAHLAPGSSVGDLTVGGLSLANGSVIDLEFDSGSTPPNDRVLVGAGGLAINGGTVNVYYSGTGTAWDVPDTYYLFSYSGGIGGAGVGALTVGNQAPGMNYSLTADGSWVKLVISSSAAVWTGATDGEWTLGANWGGTAPSAGASLTFGAAGAGNQNNHNGFAGGTSFRGITFSTEGTYTLNGNAITLIGDIDDQLAGTQTINLGLVFSGGDRAVNVADGGQLAVIGDIGEAAAGLGLTKTGDGTLVLGGANDYTGATTVSAGALLVNGAHDAAGNYQVNAGILGGSGTLNSAVNIASSATLAPGGTNATGRLTVANDIAMTGGATLHVDIQGGNAGQPVNGYDQLVVSGGKTLTFGNNICNLELRVPTGATLPYGQPLTIISGNYSGTQFIGWSEGAEVLAGSGSFTIHYGAGAVTLTPRRVDQGAVILMK